MNFLDAILLGILQGATEFLPVSSSGHLVLAQHLLGGFEQPGVLFDVLLHVGTMIAVAIYFWRDLLGLITSLWRRERAYEEVAADVDRILSERGVVTKASELLEAYEEQAVRSLRFLQNATLKGLLRRVVGKIFPRTLIEGYCSEFEARNAAGREAGASSPG